ncbi:PspC domain-containing protein, partial [Arthrobacter sp. H14]|uniref:PspC domain-containing protein n=1 Tax=Arthrobacter sp. H14 TaxID=1312959 RepID=UPI00047C8788
MERVLTRSSNGIVAGVCAGMAEHLNLSPIVVRLAMAGLSLAGGAGLLFYGWLWVMVPVDTEAAAKAEGATTTAGPAAGATAAAGTYVDASGGVAPSGTHSEAD